MINNRKKHFIEFSKLINVKNVWHSQPSEEVG